MADNPNVNGIQVAADDRSGVFVQRTVPGGATGVTVNSVSVTTGGGTLVGANPSRQALLLVNTSSVALEISPTSGLRSAQAFRFPLAPRSQPPIRASCTPGRAPVPPASGTGTSTTPRPSLGRRPPCTASQ
jgi:hypothetical protein